MPNAHRKKITAAIDSDLFSLLAVLSVGHATTQYLSSLLTVAPKPPENTQSSLKQ